MPDVATALLETLRENQAQTNAGLTVVSAAMARVQAAVERVAGVLAVSRPAGAGGGGGGPDLADAALKYAGATNPAAIVVEIIKKVGEVLVKAVQYTFTSTLQGGLNVIFDGIQKVFGPVFEAFDSLTARVRPFAEAISPVSVQLFDQAMRDTTAVIGSALLPVWQSLTGLVREFGNALVPVAKTLKPVFETIAETVSGVGKAFTGAFANILTALKPVFENLADLFAGLGAALQGVYAFISGLASVFAGEGATVGNFKQAMQELTKGILLATLALLRWYDELVGSNLSQRFGRGAAAAFGGGEKGNSEGFAPPSGASVTDLTSLSKSVAAAAFTAGEAGENKEDAWRREVLTELKLLNTLTSDQFWERIGPLLYKAFIGDRTRQEFAGDKALDLLNYLLNKVSPFAGIAGPAFNGFASR